VVRGKEGKNFYDVTKQKHDKGKTNGPMSKGIKNVVGLKVISHHAGKKVGD